MLCRCARADDVKITPDVVYGHKDGMAMTFDVFTPQATPKVSACCSWSAAVGTPVGVRPRRPCRLFKPMLDAGFTVFASGTGAVHDMGFRTPWKMCGTACGIFGPTRTSWASIRIDWGCSA